MATLPALSKTYSTIRNMPFPSLADANEATKSACWLLKQAMINSPASGTLGGTRHADSVWTVVSSSDGTTASNSDLWGTTFNSSKLIGGNVSSNHSWILLQNTALGYQFLIDLNSSGYSYMRIAASPISNPFSSGTPSSPPQNTSYEIDARSSATNNSATVASLFASYSSTNFNGSPMYLHYTTTTDGQFFAFLSRAGSGIFYSALALVKTTGAHVNDTNNVFLISDDRNDYRGALQGNGAFNAGNTVCRLPTNAYVTHGGIGPNPFYGGYGYLADGSSGDRGIDSLSGEYNVYQSEIQCFLPATLYRGIVPDLYLTGGGTIGSCIPSVDSCERTVVGSMIVPFIGGPPIL